MLRCRRAGSCGKKGQEFPENPFLQVLRGRRAVDKVISKFKSGAEKATGNRPKVKRKITLRGNPLFAKRCSVHGDHAAVLHPSLARAVNLKMHVGSTPSGPVPLPAKTLIWLAVSKG